MQREKLHFHQVPGGTGVPKPRWRRVGVGAVICLAAMGSSASVRAQGLTVNAGDTVSWGASMDLDCGDLVVNGTLDAPGIAFTRAGNVIIGAGGQLNAANTTIEVTTSWQNSGAFNAAGSTVTASNACANTSTAFSGNTTFSNLSATTAGHTLNFAAGSEQTVGGALTLTGITAIGQGGTAFLTLPTGGTQSISSVGVNGVDASHGQRLAPTAVNAITGTANNWFKATTPTTPTAATPVPTTSPAGLALLMGLMLGAAHLTRRLSGRTRGKPGQGR